MFDATKCVICGGSGHVRLPVIHPVSAKYTSESDLTIGFQESSRTYQCPECSAKSGAEEKVEILYCQAEIDSRHAKDEGALSASRSYLASEIAREFLKRGIIETTVEARDERTVIMMARIGTVSPRRAETIESRALDKMRVFLSGVLDKATDRIAMWGSYYTGLEGNISKAQAVDSVRLAWAEAMKDQISKTEKK